VSAGEAVTAFRGAAPLDSTRFRDDIDALLDQDHTPRA
jgi:hypothetical protein